MKILKYFVNHKMVSGLCALAILAVCGTIFVYARYFRNSVYCQSLVDQLVPGSGDYDIRVIEKGCEGWGGSDTMSIVLSPKKWGLNRTVFVYGRMSYDPRFKRKDVSPSVTWISNNEVQISIDMVSYISTQINQVDGIKFTYSVGAIEYK